MESSIKKLTFLNLDGASEADLALLNRILAPDHSVVQLPEDDRPKELLPVDDQEKQPVYETCRLPPDGTEYCTDEAPPTATESPPPPPPPPVPPQPPANQSGMAGDLAASAPSGAAPLAAPPHLMAPSLLPPGGAMFHQPPAGFPFHQNFPFVNLPGGGVNMMYQVAGYPPMPAGYAPPAPEPAVTETGDRRRSGQKKGSDKPLSALAPPYQHSGYPMTPRSATGQPLMMQPFPSHPYGTQYYPYHPYYPHFAGPAYGPGGEMMQLAPMPAHQLPPMPPAPMDVTVPPPAEESREPLCEPYGRAEEPVTETEDSGSVSPAIEIAETAPTAATEASVMVESPVAETTSHEASTTPTPAEPAAAAAAAAPVPPDMAAASAGPVRLSFGFDLEDKLADCDSEAVQLENTGCTPEPPEEERAGDGRSSSAEPVEPPLAPVQVTGPTSYVATVTVSQRRVMPPPEPDGGDVPLPVVEEVEPVKADRGSASPAMESEGKMAASAGSEPAVSPEPRVVTPANGAASPEPERQPAQEPPRQQGKAQEQQPGKEPEPAPTPVAIAAACPAPTPAPAPAPAAPRSWASLFSKKAEGAAPAPAVPVAPKPAPAPPVPETDQETLALGAALARFEICHKHVYLQPRGLTNKSNWCYVNAVLQALASCTPFYHLMKSLPHNVGVLPDESRTPIIDAMVEFVREFSPLAELPRIHRRDRGQLRDVQYGPPLEPSYVYAMLSRVSSDAFRVAGRQEDAEEFLTCLLSGLQDEMAEVLKVYQKSRDEGRPAVNGAANGDARHDSEEDEGDPDDWQTIIGKNRGQVTRSAELQHTPVSRVFSGQLRSSLHRQGAKATATVQSFFSLQLDIQSPHVSSVEDALEALVARDPVVGLTCPQSGQPIDAYQQAALELTPPTLILHLKRFLYDPETDGVQKLLKRVAFSVDLDLKKELLSNVRTKMSPGQKRYRLFAVVYHSGKESTKGHYITDAFHPAYQQWVRYDDSSISSVTEAAVLRPEPPLVPYILFYRRLDTVAAHNGRADGRVRHEEVRK